MAKRQLTIAEVFAASKKGMCHESLIIRARLYKIHFVAKKAESTLECLPDPDSATLPESFESEPG